MPETPARPRPPVRTVTTRHQHARQSAARIKAYAEQVLIDLNRGRPVRANARQIAADALALCETLAAMAAIEEKPPVAAPVFKPAAAGAA